MNGTTQRFETYAPKLRKEAFFRQFSDDELYDLIEACEPKQLMSGHALWHRDAPGQAAYFLIEGRIEVSFTNQPEGRRTRQVDRAGELLSLPYLVYPWPHESTAYTLERTVVLRLGREIFRSLFETEHPAAFRLAEAIASELVYEVRDANRRMHEVFGHPAETLRMLRRRARASER